MNVGLILFILFRFKLKYHPEDSVKRKDECKAALEKRIDVFSRFLDEARFKGITIDGDQSDVLVKLLDSVVIFLEGLIFKIIWECFFRVTEKFTHPVEKLSEISFTYKTRVDFKLSTFDLI